MEPQYKRLGRAVFASGAGLKRFRSVLSLVFFDFLSSVERSPFIRNSTAISWEARPKNPGPSSELLLNLPQLQGRDTAEALMKQLHTGEGWVFFAATRKLIARQRSVYFSRSVKIRLRGVKKTKKTNKPHGWDQRVNMAKTKYSSSLDSLVIHELRLHD